MIKELTIEKKGLPVGWEMKTLGEVCEIFNGSTPLKSKREFWDDGEINWFTISDIRKQGRNIKYTQRKITSEGFNSTSLTLLPKKSILLCCTASVGEYAITDVELTTNQQFNGLVVKEKNKLFPEYLFHYSSTLKEKLLSKSGKATIDFVSMTKVKTIPITLPPLPQQKQIVATLDKAFAAIDTAKANAEQNLKNAKELFESYLQNVFENKGDDWEEKTLGAVSEMIKRGSQPKYTESDNGEIVLNQKCIRDHTINLTVARKHDNNLKRINNERYVKLGDLLINSTGTGTLGRVAQVRDLNYRAFVDTHITIVRPKEDLFYLDFFGWAAIYIEKIIENSGEGASGQTELSRKLVEQLVISFPRELKIQEEIALKLDSLSLEVKKLEAIYTQKIADLEELKKSVLQKAFSGQLNTVT